ncbi:DUF190 domain-containing protein [Methanosalsum natronophilum]|uniref:DUF190 domain-containing protein n=1 Tax=Methanosalsum natronophilum TaxID=768733 RepID=A0A3R7YIJ5_9EURY|nr:DUF190 domain-containing protein [Methanosalsum natronophilum]MCS3923524.1 PII-like signaling protein [Methanosalsum natronophilum]RQD85423.1 MAG: DUF190 domain-containing protein [Methanosalsum natronophilum]
MNYVTVKIYISENDTYNGKSTSSFIVQLLREKGILGATVIRGITGYGPHTSFHSTKLLRISSDLPLIIEVVDTEDKIRPVLKDIKEIVPNKLVTVQSTSVVSNDFSF